MPIPSMDNIVPMLFLCRRRAIMRLGVRLYVLNPFLFFLIRQYHERDTICNCHPATQGDL